MFGPPPGGTTDTCTLYSLVLCLQKASTSCLMAIALRLIVVAAFLASDTVTKALWTEQTYVTCIHAASYNIIQAIQHSTMTV